MLTVYFIRHGESEANCNKRFGGQLDTPLTELGLAQARCVAKFFENIPLDAVYSSNLSRAYETARATAESHGLSVTEHVGLRELHVGVLEGLPFDQLAVQFPEVYHIEKGTVYRNRPA